MSAEKITIQMIKVLFTQMTQNDTTESALLSVRRSITLLLKGYKAAFRRLSISNMKRLIDAYKLHCNQPNHYIHQFQKQKEKM